MAPCHLKIGITATWSSKLSLNSLNLICEMNGTLQPYRLPFHIVLECFAPPLLRISPVNLNMNMSLFFIYKRNYCLSAIFARLSSRVVCVCRIKAKAPIIMFTSSDENPRVVMISNYKYFSACLLPQLGLLCGVKCRVCAA